MNKSDQNICEQVLSPGREIGRLTLVEIKRKGALLLALPMNRALALATLDLYQPQRIKGRVSRHLLRLMVRFGLHRKLGRVEFKLGDRGLFSGLKELDDVTELGFMLSGADSEHRNLIGLCEVDGQHMVVKAGCDEAAKIVTREYESQCSLANKIPGVPTCRSFFDIDGGVAYVTEFVHGRSPRGEEEDRRVLSLLEKWLSRGKRKLVANLDDWNQVINCLNDGEQAHFSAFGLLEVVSPVVHGDFAPWNIKIDAKNEIKVLDWEYAVPAGMPGWDWLHYNIQRMKLVEELSADEIITRVRNLMTESPFARYISVAGLTGHENALLGSYLFYSGRFFSYPREEEICIWLATQQNDFNE